MAANSALLLSALFSCAILAVLSCDHCGPAFDGNPHQWDRRRRCDHFDYDPPCGICEGYGGIPTGDKNDQITLTTCEPVANRSQIDPSTLKHPVWGLQWTIPNTNEVLIGKKTDPFCFQTFPSNDSKGELCYRPDHGKQVYDMKKAMALHEVITEETVVGQVKTTLTHQGTNFWIINQFPWYAAGVHQCICLNVHQGSDPTQPAVYPIQWNWTDQAGFVGREKIGVEYGVGVMTLDHWAYGPHHLWTKPEDGAIIRMWQPFNGLQVLPNGTGESGVDPAEFADIPPALCKKKGGAVFRIKCTDHGLPQTATAARQPPRRPARSHQAWAPPATRSDVKRAQQVVPRHAYKGETFAAMSEKLNGWVRQSPAHTRECEGWSTTELQGLQALLYLARDADLDSIYQEAADNRRLGAALGDLQASWASLTAAVEAHPAAARLRTVQRDAHCHEALMWYTHHISEDAKVILAESGVEVPLLAYHTHGASTCHPSAPKDRTTEQVCQYYETSVSCADCHSEAGKEAPPIPTNGAPQAEAKLKLPRKVSLISDLAFN